MENQRRFLSQFSVFLLAMSMTRLESKEAEDSDSKHGVGVSAQGPLTKKARRMRSQEGLGPWACLPGIQNITQTLELYKAAE